MPDEIKEPKKRGPKPGGRRGGMPKGHKTPQTIEKEAAKAALRQMVLEELRPLVRSQMHSAMGLSHFMLRDPATGMFKRLTEVEEIDAALKHPDAKEGSSYWIFTKDPQTPAFVDLMNRAIGKPTEEVNTTLTINQPLAERIKQVRKKLGV